MLSWANRFNICCFLDNHHYHFSHHQYECLLGANSLQEKFLSSPHPFHSLQQFADEENDWLFGHLAFELGDTSQTATPDKWDGIGFPGGFFFKPETLIQLNEKEMLIGRVDAGHEKVWNEISSQNISARQDFPAPQIQNRISKEEYLSIITSLQQHILRGDCYEINFCQEFFADHATIPPLQIYFALGEISPNPFSAYYKLHDKYLLCASPERFLKKEGMQLFSQPIKGTGARDLENELKDEQYRKALQTSEKDKSENVMVVDLVRNDLSRVCKEGTVKVEELFGVYAFPQVHQMISTVSGTMKEELSFTDALEACFPMGSMTGAPKRSVLNLIGRYEKTKRGLFSGALGYIQPNQDFDFNVVIRSLLYNESAQYLSYQAGSGITFYSDPEKEYEECLLKAAAIKKVLE